jgi:hypothetical protein
MKKLNKQSIVIALVVAFVLGLTGVTAFAAGPTTVDLKTAAPFAILAGTPAITDSPTSVITGNVGMSPRASSYIGLLCTQVTGTIYAIDGTGNACFTVNAPLVVTAKGDLTAAYTDAANRTPVTIVPTELGGQTLGPGVYASDSTFLHISAPTPLILDGQGNPNAVFIFEASDVEAPALVPGPGSVVQLTGQAQACNVFWRVNAATINTTAVFKGTILAYDSITVANGANIEGRLLAQTGQVTLINDTITVPTCVAGSTTPVAGSTTPVVPGLPNTGIGSDNKNSTPWSIIIPAGAVVTLSSLYLVRKKRTT